ncbi:MAG: tRNA pseudouridine(55) synthase TruB [Cyclobacteriaceae bacterium]
MSNHTSPEGEILLINKPLGWTSFDVVKKLRNLLKIKKIGHAGTLDPLASGLLILCTGRKTKKINEFQEQEKEYEGTLVIGKTTPSVDLETEFDNERDYTHITEDDLKAAARHLTGYISQIPPLYSAVKVQGERAYNLARSQRKAALEPRMVEIKQFSLQKIEIPEVHFKVVCSKGTYIRSLVRDMGEHLGTGAYLCALKRTRIGDFSITDARQITDFEKIIK